MDEKGNRLPVDSAGLWKGCILALCVHGVMLPEYPFILNEQFWLDGVYLTQDNEGAKAALLFSEETDPLIGLFRQTGSSRIEFALSEKYAAFHFKTASQENRELAAAMFPLFEENMGEQKLPVVTTGFWSDGKALYSRDSFEEWYENGGQVLERQIMPFEDAMDSYMAYYGMDGLRAEIIERVYRERVKSPLQPVVLSKRDVDTILERGPYNRDACREAFSRFQVYFEKD